jgi:[protein-PII] uridylyltransferase
VADPLVSEALALWRSKLGALWLPSLGAQMAERHRSQGDLAFLLEPDLKEAHGGLRDANVLRAMAVYAPKLADYVDLESIEPAVSTLTEIRVELHRRAGRALDRLLLQEQDQVASLLSFEDADDLMASVSRVGRIIAWAVDEAWRRQRSWLPVREPRFARRRVPQPMPIEPVEVEPGVVIVGPEVA